MGKYIFYFIYSFIYFSILFYSLRAFHTSVSWWFSTGDSLRVKLLKSLRSVLADHNNAGCLDGLHLSSYLQVGGWSALVLLFTLSTVTKWQVQGFSPCTSHLVTVPSAPITIGVTVSLARSRYLSFFLLSFNFTQCLAGTAKFTIWQVLFFYLFIYFLFFYFLFCFFFCVGGGTITMSGLLAEIRWSQNHKEFWASHFLGWILGCAYTICSYGQIHYYFSHGNFFTSALVDGFSLEFEWQQVSSNPRSKWYYSLDGLHSSTYFQVLQSLYNSFGDCTEHTNWIGIAVTFMSHSFFNSLAKSRYLSFFIFFQCSLCSQLRQQSPQFDKFSFSCRLLLGLVV